MKKLTAAIFILFTLTVVMAAAAKVPSSCTEQEKSMNITIDFKKFNGKKIKALHGVNNSPLKLDKPIDTFIEAGIPYTRLHDTGGAYGRNVFVDIPNIFPDFDADENDPASYRFEFTDAYLKQLYASGTKVFYRLGVTIENNYKIRAYHIHPPKDFAKWARICERIIRHYNEGWANGFKYGIEYWEVWNEPENPPMWQGTREQFFELYKVTARHLKKCFPNIKVGGYASCGFYGLRDQKDSAFHRSFVEWAEKFTEMCAKENIPLDFYSWHRYFNDPDEIIFDAEYVRKLLDKNGLTKTESIFNEWNYYNWQSKYPFDLMKEAEGASNIAKAFILLQKLPVDKAMYYNAYPSSGYGGMYYFPSGTVTPTYYSFKTFNSLYKLGSEVECDYDNSKIAVLAAGNGKAGALIAANNKDVPVKANFILQNVQGNIKAFIIDKKRTFEEIKFTPEFEMPPYSVLLVEINSNTGNAKVTQDTSKVNFAGLDNSNNNK